MGAHAGIGAVLLGALLVVAAVHVVHRLTAIAPTVGVLPFLSGAEPREHAFSRFHARWYVASLVFLAFDVEMLFMYPWVLVVGSVGVGAVVEMFVFLGVLMAGVVWAWREGAFEWA